MRSGAPGGTRTHGLLLRRQTLYPLSYGRTPDEVTSATAVEMRRPLRRGVAFTVPADPATEVAGLLPRHEGIYHAGCTGYPNPTYP